MSAKKYRIGLRKKSKSQSSNGSISFKSRVRARNANGGVCAVTNGCAG
jgi:hypothetical protein